MEIEKYIQFHGEINWYTLDCFTQDTQIKLKKLPISTYKLTIGNMTIHYFSWELPKAKDFYCMTADPKLIKELRTHIKKSKYFNTSKLTITKAKQLIKKGTT